MSDSKKLWWHVKSGGMYELLHIGKNENDETEMAIYRNVQGEQVWVRPYSQFIDKFLPCEEAKPTHTISTKIQDFPLKIKGKETPERILKDATAWANLTDVVVVGIINDDDIAVSGTQEKVLEVIGLLEMAKIHLFNQE